MWPPIGNNSPSALFAESVSDLPCLSVIQPTGIGLPCIRFALTVPYDTTVVAMSSSTGGSSPAGTANAIGLVPSRFSELPQTGMWLALATTA